MSAELVTGGKASPDGMYPCAKQTCTFTRQKLRNFSNLTGKSVIDAIDRRITLESVHANVGRMEKHDRGTAISISVRPVIHSD
jgi:hypothetical protein